MSYPYAKLGNNCESHTLGSLTSNAKYILPLSSIYYKRWTPMLYYPGMENMDGVRSNEIFGSGGEPENVKAYDTPNNSTHSQQIQKKCTSCKSCN
jgi:hypothetical protein